MQLLSDAHLGAVAFMVLAAVVLVRQARRHPGRWTVTAARVLALAIFVAWAGEYLAEIVSGTWTLRYDLPLQLTDAISVVAVLALLTRRPALVELTFFWGLTAALQAVLTPDLSHDFPSIYFVTFFGYHVGAVLAACLLVFGCRLYPRRGAVWRVFATTVVVALVAGLCDLLTGGDYMFLRAKPAHGSLLSVMGPWPWYLLATAALALAMLYVVEIIADAVRRHDDLAGAGERGRAPSAPRIPRLWPPKGRLDHTTTGGGGA